MFKGNGVSLECSVGLTPNTFPPVVMGTSYCTTTEWAHSDTLTSCRWEGQRSGGAQESHPSLLVSDSDFSSLSYTTRCGPPRLFAFHFKPLSLHFSHHRSRSGRKGGRNSQDKLSCQCLMGTDVKYYPEERKFGVLPLGFLFPVLFLLLNDKEGWRSACILLRAWLKTRHLLLLSVLSEAQEV